MKHADYHPQCTGMVRVSLKDANGPFSSLFPEHPDTHQFERVKVGTCELAAGHEGRCEMFADADPGRPYRGNWLTWPTPSAPSELSTESEWVTSTTCCQAQSPNGGWGCNRYAGHGGGHSFISFLA